MRIVEQALREFRSYQVHPRTGTPIPPPEMVDLARWATSAIRDDSAVTCPTLGGSGRDSILPCHRRKRVFLRPRGYLRQHKNSGSLVMFGHGVRPPRGEVYFPVEGGNGELGFYVVSDGSGSPYRVRVRPPCFAIMSALSKILTGDMIADMIPTFGSVNMIGGELDR